MPNPKEKYESQIKEIVESFEKETGLKAGWIDLPRENVVGFSTKPEILNCKIKLKDE